MCFWPRWIWGNPIPSLYNFSNSNFKMNNLIWSKWRFFSSGQNVECRFPDFLIWMVHITILVLSPLKAKSRSIVGKPMPRGAWIPLSVRFENNVSGFYARLCFRYFFWYSIFSKNFISAAWLIISNRFLFQNSTKNCRLRIALVAQNPIPRIPFFSFFVTIKKCTGTRPENAFAQNYCGLFFLGSRETIFTRAGFSSVSFFVSFAAGI